MAMAFSTPSDTAINRPLSPAAPSPFDPTRHDLTHFFELERTSALIRRGGYARVRARRHARDR